MAVKIISIKSELGAGVPGAGLGVDALHVVALNNKSDLFTACEEIEVPHHNSRLFGTTSYPFAKFVDSILSTQRKVCTTVAKTLQAGRFPLLLTGDHSSAYGVIAGVKKQYPNQRLGVVWIDAHPDLHSPYTTSSGNMHGMPLAMASQINNEGNRRNQPDDATLDYWQRMWRVGTSSPKIQLNDVCYIAVRDIDAPENALIQQYGIRCIPVAQVRKLGAKACAQKALEQLQYCDLIYVSFDVDSISAGFSKGTGTPVFKGLTLLEAESLNRELARSPKLCAWEVTEINPLNDTQNKMAKGIFPIIEHIAHVMGNKSS